MIYRYAVVALAFRLNRYMINRAHRICSFSSAKSGPIVVQLRSFKEKQIILDKSHKLRNSNLSISEDVLLRARLERKKLIQHAKEHNDSFKHRFNSLATGEKSLFTIPKLTVLLNASDINGGPLSSVVKFY